MNNLHIANLVSGTFTVTFGWAEGNLDTGARQQDVAAFAKELHEFLLEHGAWDVTITSCDDGL